MKNSQLDNLRHSAAHLLAAAVMELYPETKRTIGPAIENGFYFDFDFPSFVKTSDGKKEPFHLVESDLPKIEKKMREIVSSWDTFKKIEVSKEEAMKEFADNPYKLELIEEFAQDGKNLTLYKSGSYQDLCKGGHVENPKQELKHFKLLSLAGAYWRGNEKNKMLTRIYGTVFPTKEELDTHLWQLEEAKKRDHRKLGQELDLFFIDEMVGKGLIMWLPHGTIIRDEIENFAKKMEKEGGYLRVVTPHIAKEELFLTSGHLPYYKDSMFPSMKTDDGTYYLKAMNCPHHHRIFRHGKRSYREMPVRLAEYGTCYRNELSGTLSGLLRVRAMSMNDAHIYCTKDQVKSEFKAVMELTQHYLDIFSLKDYWFRLSKWDPKHTEKYINEPKNWEYTQKIIKEVLQEMEVDFVEADDEAAFYGPKVDVQLKSIVGREETMSTIQLDFAAKKRFDLRYTDDSGNENNDVFVIHRAPLSVHERFLAFLIEHYAGAFPTWLSPIQVIILPVADSYNDYGKKVADQLQNEGIRVEVNLDNKTLGAKIRESTLKKIPFMVIIGDKEEKLSEKELHISVRTREGQNQDLIKLSDFIEEIKEKITKKK